MNKRKFWKFLNDIPDEETVLRLDGPIANESWFGDEVMPALFLSELNAHPGDLTVWINSPGGDVFAASQIYTMLMDHKGNVTVKIDGIAASAASVIAMAGGEVFMSPTSMIMIHNPMTLAFGWKDEMEKAVDVLDEVKASIINAYELKTGLSRNKISRLMDEETWMNARKAKELGFCDAILFSEEDTSLDKESVAFAARKMATVLFNKIYPVAPQVITAGTAIKELEKRLELLSH